MRAEHRNIQKWIKARYGNKYNVEAEIDGQNYLPDRVRHWYQPDVVLRSSKDEIKCIIEVENNPMRKALVGASVLADCSVAALKQQNKPRLIFVVYTKIGIKQIPNFKQKLKITKKYYLHLKSIRIYSELDFKALQL
ncbi:MAG TPA: hypothetical protein VGB16_06755 [candidate division Zixibacteria bacterium]